MAFRKFIEILATGKYQVLRITAVPKLGLNIFLQKKESGLSVDIINNPFLSTCASASARNVSTSITCLITSIETTTSNTSLDSRSISVLPRMVIPLMMALSEADVEGATPYFLNFPGRPARPPRHNIQCQVLSRQYGLAGTHISSQNLFVGTRHLPKPHWKPFHKTQDTRSV